MDVDWTYQLIMAVAVTAGVLVSRRSQSRLSVAGWQRWGLLLGAFCGAMIGAKLPYLFGDWDALVSGVAWVQNGKTILFGLVGGYVGVEATKWSLDIRTKTGDSFALPVAVSIAIGRWGCFHAGCCYGVPSDLPWATVFPAVDALPRHPTQVYESIFHAAAALAIVGLQRAGYFRGHLIKLYIIAYAVYRLFSESVRPEPRLLLGLTVYQWFSLGIMLGFAVLWYGERRRAVRGHSPGNTVSQQL
jgi:phosphatidylglycerol:prolipoprotein diacylglycerol transferase